MPEKKIADRRIYGYDHHGREVLVAAKGQPIPPGFTERAASPASDEKPKRGSSRKSAAEKE